MFPLLAQEAPKPRLELGFEERVRMEDWDNLGDHRDATVDYRTQFRFRTRGWAVWRPAGNLDITAGLVNENRKITRPDMAANGRQVAVETLMVDWRFAPGWSVKAGRQNLSKGEGFVFMDGSALDGSRTTYVNAVDLAWTSGDHTVEAIVLRDPKRDTWLPRLNEPSDPRETVRLNEWDESAQGLYYTGRLRPGTALEAYAFRKTERDDYRGPASPKAQPNRQLGIFGSRLVQDLGGGFSFTGEGALERGRQEARPGGQAADIRAWGGYARVKKAFEHGWKPTFSMGVVGLSGDDPATPEREGWDPLFSRFPKWSELYVYSQVPEAEIGYWTNTRMVEVEARCQPSPWLALRATWYRLGAFHAIPAKGPIFGSGRLRGDLFQTRADLTFSSAWKGHILYERLTPGSFYTGPNGGHFFRVEGIYTFRKGF